MPKATRTRQGRRGGKNKRAEAEGGPVELKEERPKGRWRSEGSRDERKARYLKKGGTYEKGQEKLQRHTKIIKCEVPFPDHFAGWTRDGEMVKRMVKELWPTLPADLPNASNDPSRRGAWLWDKLPAAEVAALEEDGAPKYLAMRWAECIPDETLKMLVRLWDTLNRLGVKFPDAELQRLGSPALHLGLWELYMDLAKITTDSRQTKLEKSAPKEEILAAIDALCRTVKERVVPRLERLMKCYMPEQQRVQERIHLWLAHRHAEQLTERPDMDFGGTFFTVAVKEGGSERIHIDWNNNLHKFALIFAAGDWEGGEFCIPQLGIRIPLRPGQVIAVRTRLLAHCTAPIMSGRRVVFTCFTDSFLLEHTLSDKDYTIL
ncbi:hypothetical protein C8F04DRAFT_1275325 [Mycena alexandri]|uniref:Uncharacterized protein n=1 Tax=Mycena alexandri TaxID=1745969 RepID=A0AAD6WPG3_9AGAR|nr:hypothetical protein C8F04DRAFT_1275325 [Mycena alexandri]